MICSRALGLWNLEFKLGRARQSGKVPSRRSILRPVDDYGDKDACYCIRVVHMKAELHRMEYVHVQGLLVGMCQSTLSLWLTTL